MIEPTLNSTHYAGVVARITKWMDLENRFGEMAKQMAQMAQLLQNFQATWPAATVEDEEEELESIHGDSFCLSS